MPQLPKTTQVTTQRSPRVLRESTTLDSFWDDLHANTSKQQEKVYITRYNMGQTMLVNAQLLDKNEVSVSPLC